MTIKRLVIISCIIAGAAGLTASQENHLTECVGAYLGQKPPGDIPVLFAPGIVSTGKEHSAAMFTPDSNEVWFGRMFPAKIYYMKRVDDRWSEPRVAPFCDSFNYLYPILTGDGAQVFFSTDRPVDQNGERYPRGDVDIWMVRRKSGGWSEPVRLDDNVNLGRRNSCGSVAANGNLYFTARKNDASTDIYRSQLLGSGYAPGEPLTDIDSPAPDHCPFVAPDESYLIFSSFRGGLGKSDLFISFRDQDGTWSEPINMGPKINSPYKDEYPYVTPDGKYLFFNSNRPSILNDKPIPDGPGNIYWIDSKIIENFRQR